MQNPKNVTRNQGMMKNAWRSLGAGAALIILLTVLAYLPALRGGFIWDDDSYVTQNQTLRDLNGLRQIWFEVGATAQYYPLVHTTFWLEYHLWKLDPRGYHAVNVLLHALAAILLWRVLLRLQVLGAGLAAFIFALHPVCVESVAWVTERKNVLSAVFYFAATLAWLRFAQNTEGKMKNAESKDRKAGAEPPAAGNTRAPWPLLWYFLALGLFAAALLSKTVTCSLPAALLLVCWWKKGRLRAGDILPAIPFFVLGVVLGLNTALMEKHHVGASGPEWAFSFFDRCLIAGRALWFYAGKLVWPANLTFSYPRWEIHSAAGWQWLFPIAAVGVVAALWFFRHRIGRGPLVAVLFFAGTLFPALGFLNVYPMRYSFVADHFQYLASVGLIVLAAAGLTRWRSGFGVCADHPAGRGIVIQLLPLALGVLTWQQAHIYHDLETLWRDTLTKNPGAWLAHNNLGVILCEQGRIKEAVEHCNEAVRIQPGSAEVHNNLALALVQQGRIEEAIGQYKQALRLKPDYAVAHHNWGLVLARQGKPEEAIAHWKQALRLKPDFPEVHYNWGVVLEQLGEKNDAIGHYEQALRFKPDYAEAHDNLGLILARQGRLEEAIARWKQALRFKPDYAEAHNNWGIALEQLGRKNDAIGHYEQALRLKPDYAEARNNLGTALLAVGRFPEAVAHYNEVVRIHPGSAEAHNNLALALAQQGRIEEAIGQYEQALRLKPDYPEAHHNWGLALAQQDRLEEAISHWEQALRLKPDYPEVHNNLGVALEQLGRKNDAIGHFEAALRYKPDFAGAHNNLATVLGNIPGRIPEAIEHFEAALRYDPDSAEAHNNFGNLLIDIPGRLNEGIARLEAALRLQPDYAEAHRNLSIALSKKPGRLPEAITHLETALRLKPDLEGGQQMLEHLRELQRQKLSGKPVPPS
jgi:tetratricopeptide (TPR) repeat protein